jgi:opacity protein-like surface antigen
MRSCPAIAVACACIAAIVPRAWSDEPPFSLSGEETRFYVSGIVGDAFTTISSGGLNTAGGGPVANTGATATDLLALGGALGGAVDRPDGELRLEIEALGRGALNGETDSVFPPQTYAVRADDSWTVMANVWREYSLADRVGIYGGGGIGAGGYRIAVDDLTVSGAGVEAAFAWQVGTGVTWRIGPRATLDFGYRFLDLAPVSTPLTLGDGTLAGNYTSALSASEWLLSVRIYEPFAKVRR